MEWLANNESSLSAIAAIIAIIAGLAVVFRLVWIRMVARKRPAFLSDWRNIALISISIIALLAVLLLATDTSITDQSIEQAEAPGSITGKPSVAVLPLNYIADDQSQAYLADAITEDVITLLSRNPRFFVIARNSTYGYKDMSPDIRTVGQELGVRYVVEGSVSKIGERLRVTVQLINTSNNQHLWAEQYDRPFVEIFALQDEITNGITVALGDEIFSAEIARANATPTDNLDAWGLVMRASQAGISWNDNSSMEAVELLQGALDLNPDYALAQAELARALCWRAVNLWGDNPAEAIAEAYKLSTQALQTNSNDPLIVSAVGGCYGVTGRREEAIRLLKKAITKQPNFAYALAVLGLTYIADEQPAQGLPHIEKALLLAPKSPYLYQYETWRSFGLLELGDYEEAEQALQLALESYEGWWWPWLNLAAARAGQGNIKGAIKALYTAREKEPLFSFAFFKGTADFSFKNKGAKTKALLEPIWPEDLLTTAEN